MQVVIYTHVFSPMVGGIETITMELARRLAWSTQRTPEDAVKVTVVTPKAQSAAHEDELPFTIVRKPSLLHLVSLIRNADIFHVAGTDMLPLFLGWLLRKRMVVEHHTFQTACPNGQMFYESAEGPCPGHFMAGKHSQCLKCNSAGGLIHTLKRWLSTFPRRWLCLHAQANVMPTEWLGSVLRLPRMVTIHHGLPAWKSSGTPKVGTIPSIVFVGRLVSTKGVRVLLQAAEQITDYEFELNIIGDGPERKRLEAEVRSRRLEGRVVFRGYLGTDEIERAIAAARAVVMPSLGGEVFGLVALENMLRKKVMIVSEIGSLTEVIGDTGLTFPAGDATALAGCLRRVLLSNGFVERTGLRAANRANLLFTPERMVDDHLVLYRQLLGDAPGGDLCA
jgi:glycogen(starch) synthase